MIAICVPTNPCTVLFVEDEPTLLELITRQEKRLLERGVLPLYARTFAEAESILKSVEVVIIILDLGLHDRKGLDTLESVYELVKEKETPIYVYTGDDDPELRARALECGATEVFCKGDMPILYMLTFAHHAANEERKTQTLRNERQFWKDKAESVEAELNALKEMVHGLDFGSASNARMKTLENVGRRIEKIQSLVATR